MSVKTAPNKLRSLDKIAFNMRLDPDVYAALSKKNSETRLPMAKLVERALREFLGLKESAS